jgi:RNA polymerase sigma-70 factor (sigma-E family)
MMAAVGVDGVVESSSVEAEVEALFRSEYRSLVRLASLLLGDRAASEEVVQDAFVRLQLGWRGIREPGKAPAWLRSAVLNGARSRLRRRAVRRRGLEPVAGPAPAADAGALAADERRRVVAALRFLPARQREALVLRFYLDLSEAATAEAMGVSAGSVKTHVHRGLAALHDLLGEDADA